MDGFASSNFSYVYIVSTQKKSSEETYNLFLMITVDKLSDYHCVKIVRIRRFSAPYSVRMRENVIQKNCKYEKPFSSP